MARPKRYQTGEALKRAVENYFAGISREEEQNGHRVRVWQGVPSMAGLCIHLGIGKSTWARYEGDEAMEEAARYAKLMMEDFWVQQLVEKGASGAKFALSANYGWTDKATVGMDEGTGRAAAERTMSLEEKAALLKEVARDFGGA